MDPFIETQMWEDFHTSLSTYLRDELNPRLPGDLRARLEKRVYVESRVGEYRGWYVPDVHVHTKPARPSTPAAIAGSVLVKEPLVIPFKAEFREHEVRIVDVSRGNAVVTVIEIVSPWNKRGDGREEYRRKQVEYLDGNVNIVEVDLIRVGQPVTLGARGAMSETETDDQPLDYHVSVFESSQERLLCYRYPLREPLSGFRVPLRSTDIQPVIDLQKLVDATYEKGGYEDIDYTKPLRPPLSPADAEWAQALLAGRVLPK